jgi:hypothetical protein
MMWPCGQSAVRGCSLAPDSECWVTVSGTSMSMATGQEAVAAGWRAAVVVVVVVVVFLGDGSVALGAASVCLMRWLWAGVLPGCGEQEGWCVSGVVLCGVALCVHVAAAALLAL